MASVRSPGAGLQGGEGGAAGLHQHVVDRATGEDHQLEFDERVFEVFLGGRALVDAAVGRLQRADEQTVFCLQDAALGADLDGGSSRGRIHKPGSAIHSPRRRPSFERKSLLTSFLLSLFSFCRCHLSDM